MINYKNILLLTLILCLLPSIKKTFAMATNEPQFFKKISLPFFDDFLTKIQSNEDVARIFPSITEKFLFLIDKITITNIQYGFCLLIDDLIDQYDNPNIANTEFTKSDTFAKRINELHENEKKVHISYLEKQPDTHPYKKISLNIYNKTVSEFDKVQEKLKNFSSQTINKFKKFTVKIRLATTIKYGLYEANHIIKQILMYENFAFAYNIFININNCNTEDEFNMFFDNLLNTFDKVNSINPFKKIK
ncbi:hypothetical protein GF322_04900 [Candidatus Dependentiae bacterium]|nr:hypothetical protein [Candidatus Dependentiae bacterium]